MQRENPQSAESVSPAFPIVVSPALAVAGRPADPLGRPLAGYTPPEDATAVRLLRAAGAEFAGNPRAAELAFGLVGDTTARTLKETGSAAALGLDTRGEVRLAAAAAGLIGYRPSWGIFSRSGVIGLVPSMEAIGLVAKKVSTIGKLAALLAVPDPADFSMRRDLPQFPGPAPAAPPRLGLVGECRSGLSPEESGALGRAVGSLGERGFAVTEVSLPEYDLFSLVHRIVGPVEASSAAGNYDGVRFGPRAGDAANWNEMYLNTRSEIFTPLVKSYLFQGAFFQFRDYPAFENAARLRRRLAGAAGKLFREFDFLVFPALRPAPDPAKAGTVAETAAAFLHAIPAAVLGAPAITLPGYAREGGRDFGLQLIGPPLADAALLRFAGRLSPADSEPGERERQ